MRTSNRLIALALAGVAIPVFGQQDQPESILPPGFGTPTPPAANTTVPAPSAAPKAQTGAVPQDNAVQSSLRPLPPVTAAPSDGTVTTPDAAPPPTPIPPEILAQYELPAASRRSLSNVGLIGPSELGLAPDAFGTADGRYVETLMRRLSAPLPSRWMSIVLRRMLVSRLATPPRINGADFAAERAWLLIRMGESVAARAIVQDVDTANYTPKLYQVAMNAVLATGDPGGLCPLVDGNVLAAPKEGWTLARAMCAGLSGDSREANRQITAARRRNGRGFDLQLAEKVAGSGSDARQAVTIEWTGVNRLSIWRFGLAIATGVAIPEALIADTGAQVRSWLALAPSLRLSDRIDPAEWAAAQGVLSSAALVDLYSAIDTDDDTSSAARAAAEDLRTAYIDRDRSKRLAALGELWKSEKIDAGYARLVLTARASARISPEMQTPDAARLVAAMLTAGYDYSASRWRAAVDPTGDAWAMIELSDPYPRARISYGAFANYSGSGNAALKQRLLFAGLAGLQRLDPNAVERGAKTLNVPIATENPWTRALDRAVEMRQPGMVVLLCAAGMQTSGWNGVPPEALYRIVASLQAVGLEGEARMIAAEAIARA